MIEDTYKKKKRAAWRISIYLVSPSEGQIPEFYERRRALLVHIGRLCTLSRKIGQKHSTTKCWSYIKRMSVCNESLRFGKDRQEGQPLIMKSLCSRLWIYESWPIVKDLMGTSQTQKGLIFYKYFLVQPIPSKAAPAIPLGSKVLVRQSCKFG